MLKKLLCSQSLYDMRIQMCNNCPHKTKMNTCEVCKCVLPLKAKFIFSKCPKNKWEKNYMTFDDW